MPENPYAKYLTAAPQQAAPQADPIVKPAPVDKPKVYTPPAGYTGDPTGLAPIPGGPADPKAPQNQPKPKADSAQATEGERNNSAYYDRALRALKVYDEAGQGPRGYVGETVGGMWGGDTLLRAVDSPERRISEQAKRDFATIILRSDSGANAPEQEVDRLVGTFFPKAGETDPDVLANYAAARAQALQGLRSKAGRLVGDAPAYAAPTAVAREPEMRGGVPVGSEIRFGMDSQDEVFDRSEYLRDQYGLGGDDEAKIVAFWNANRGNRGLTTDAVRGWYAKNNLPAPTDADIENAIKDTVAGREKGGLDTSDAEAQYRQQLQGFNDARANDPGNVRLAEHGISLGASDEAAGIGGAIAAGLQGENPITGYQVSRDADRLMLEQSRAQGGWAGTGMELLGGLASGGVNSLIKASPNMVKEATGIGALGGFNYGEGTQGSIAGAATNAMIAGTLSKGAATVGNYLATRTNPARAQMGTRAAELNRAGQAEGVTVNRAMVDPGLANRTTGVDASLAGGRRVQGEMSRIEGQIEGRVKGLGANGREMDNLAGGDTVKGAAERFIDKTGKSAKVKYDRAEKMAGNAKVSPKESLRRVDEMIQTLGETPASNKLELAFLKEIREDISKDLSVGGLRRMRTKLRKKISKGDLVFGEDEANVLAIMDGAADDIRAGLTAQGKGNAAAAFDAADKSYRARMEYINGTIQKVIGKRNANHSAEQIYQRFENLSKPSGDSRSLRKLYAMLDPDEAADVAATFAGDLGKNNKGEFSVAHFLSQSNNLSDQALLTIFGKEGAESVRNLRALGKEVNRVTGTMNSRTSKSAIPGDYRSWLFNLAVGGGGVLAEQPAVIGAAVTLGSVKAARDVLSARALMSPNITKWLKMAPNTASPKAINTHFARLAGIARLEPAIANDIEVFRNAVMRAANDNPTVARSVAKDEDAEQR